MRPIPTYYREPQWRAYLKDQFEEWQKTLAETGEAAAHSQFSDAINKISEALETARSKAEAYALFIGDIAKNEISIAQALASQLQLINAVAAARAAEAKAAETRDKAATARKEKAGEITLEQAIISDAKTEVDAAKAEAAAKKKEAEDVANAKQAALDKSALDQEKLDADKHAADQAVIQAQIHRDRLKNFGPEGKVDLTTIDPNSYFQNIRGPEQIKIEKLPVEDAIKKAQEQVDKLAEAIENLKSKQGGLDNASDKAIVQVDIDKLESAKTNAEVQLKNFQHGADQYRRAFSPDSNQGLQDKQHTAEEADKRARANETEIKKLRDELIEARKISAATGPIVDQTLADRIATIFEQAVTKLYSQPHGGDVEAGVHLADQVEHGKQLTGDSEQALMELANALGAHAQNIKQAANFVEHLKDNAGEFYNAVVTMMSSQNAALDGALTRIRRLENYSANH